MKLNYNNLSELLKYSAISELVQTQFYSSFLLVDSFTDTEEDDYGNTFVAGTQVFKSVLPVGSVIDFIKFNFESEEKDSTMLELLEADPSNLKLALEEVINNDMHTDASYLIDDLVIGSAGIGTNENGDYLDNNYDVEVKILQNEVETTISVYYPYKQFKSK